MIEAKAKAQGDVSKFLEYYQSWVVKKVEDDATITRLAYWKCYR
jgi:hypothetical protein